MWGSGGRVYWGKKGGEAGFGRGIVVVCAWAASVDEQGLECFVDLYASLRWDSLLCHAHFLSPFFPEKATSLAIILLNEIVKELRIRPRPIVFAAFSGGPKACMYKVFQIILGTCEAHLNPDDNQLVRNCISGHIYDSGPVDFTSDMGARFSMHPAILKLSGPLKLASWVARGLASGLDALLLTKFECQRTEYWETLYSSVDFGASFLILCSVSDDLAPYNISCNFAQRLRDLGGDVKLTKWNGSSHLGHYRYYPAQYKAAITELLEKSAALYSQRRQQLERESAHDEISELICNLQKVADSSNQSLRRVALGPSDHFFLPSSSGNRHNGNPETVEDEGEKGRSVLLISRPHISAHSILGQALFDACVPKNVEGWDCKFSDTLNGQPVGSSRRCSPLHSIKRMRHSRL